MLVVRPFGNVANQELRKIENEFNHHNAITLDFEHSFISNCDDIVMVAYFDFNEIDFSYSQFTDYDLLICRNAEGLEHLRSNFVVIDDNAELPINHLIDIISTLVSGDQLISVDFCDVSSILKGKERSIVIKKDLIFKNEEELKQQTEYFVEKIRDRYNIKSFYLLVNILASYSFSLDDFALIGDELEMLKANQIISGLSVLDEFPDNRIQLNLVLGIDK